MSEASKPTSVHFAVRSIGGYGPSLYIQRGGFLLHTWAKWFHMPYHRGFKWRLHLVIPHGHMRSRVNVGNG
jgi:hypothetical protein